MLRTFASRTLAAAAALAVAAVPAVSALASPARDPVPVGPRQFLAGLVFGTAQESQIEVACAGPATTGHPMADQSVEAILVAPPAPRSAGFTGTRARKIRVALSWIMKGKTVTRPIGTLTGYYETLAVTTGTVVPCGGTGTMTFTPSPGSKPAKTARVSVTFLSPGA
jgi:hypothetical protein